MTKTHEITSVTGSNKARLWTVKCSCGSTATGGYRKAAERDHQRHLDAAEAPRRAAQVHGNGTTAVYVDELNDTAKLQWERGLR